MVQGALCQGKASSKIRVCVCVCGYWDPKAILREGPPLVGRAGGGARTDLEETQETMRTEACLGVYTSPQKSVT